MGSKEELELRLKPWGAGILVTRCDHGLYETPNCGVSSALYNLDGLAIIDLSQTSLA